MRVGIVDIGSNTARLLVADVDGGDVAPVASEREYLGLGAVIADTGTLRRKTIAETARVVSWFADEARELGVQRAQVIVTAPGRQGRASDALVAALREATRFPVAILGSDEEGRLAYDGAVARLEDRSVCVRVGVVDVGGGSTELGVGDGTTGATWLRSVELGSLRLTRLALASDPPSKRELGQARAAAAAAFRDVRPPRPALALATGGSARAVAKLVGPMFDADDVDTAVAILAGRRSAKVARRAGIDPDRAGTVLAGALLLAEASRALRRPLRLARGGLREGAALALASERRLAAA